MKHIYLLLFSTLAIFTSQAQPSYLNKEYSEYRSVEDCIKNNEGYLLLTTAGTSEKISLIQIDLHGDTVWTTTFGNPVNAYYPKQIMKGGAYGGYIILGTVIDSIHNPDPYESPSRVFIAQLDADYNLKGIEVFGDATSHDTYGKGIFTNNGKLIIVGSTSNAFSSPFFIKLELSNNVYNIVQQKDLDAIMIRPFWYSNSNSGINSIILSENNLLFTFDQAKPFETGAGVAKIDTSGNLIWQKQYSNTKYHGGSNYDGLYDLAHDLVSLNNNRFLLVSTAFAAGPGTGYNPQPLHFYCIDGSTGNPLWVKSYGDSIDNYGAYYYKNHIACNTNDSTYLIPGNSGTVLKFNQFGDTLGFKHYNYNGHEGAFNGIIAGYYGGYAIYGGAAGEIDPDPVYNDKAWLIQTDCLLNDSTVLNPVQQNCCRFPYDTYLDYDFNKTLLCKGDSITITAYPSGASFLWNNGAESQSITIKTQGIYYVTVSQGLCTGTLGPITVMVDTLLKPTINKQGNELTSNYTIGNQWYKDSVLIVGAINQTYNTQGIQGDYRVAVSNVCGLVYSNSVLVTGVNENSQFENVKIWPNPVINGELKIENGQLLTHIEIYNLLAERSPTLTLPAKEGTLRIDVSMLPKGMYIVHLIGTKGSTVRKIRIE